MWCEFLYSKMAIVFMVQMLAALVLLSGRLQKREYFNLRALSCVSSLLVLAVVADRVSFLVRNAFGFWFYIGLFFILFVFICLSIMLCFHTTLYDALFCGMAAYAVQNSLYQFTIMVENVLLLAGVDLNECPVAAFILLAICHLLAYLGVYKLMASLARQHYPVDKIRLTALFCVMLVVVLRVLPTPRNTTIQHYIAWLFLHILVNLLSLYIMFGMSENNAMKLELDTMRKMWKLKEEHYEQSRQVTESINIKCHDLKYQISALRKGAGEGLDPEALREIENAVMIYDSIAKTGNDALDTVLTEKSLFCERNGIRFTYMADGKKLDFIRPMDIYVIFGNALDNAIESVMKLPEPEQRIITLKVSGNDKILSIQLQNAYRGELRVEDGLPLTSKKDSADHGYGMKSIQILARKYGGDMTFSAENGIFSMNILLSIK